MYQKYQKVFIGGYTKSGTTFVGRAFGILNGVYAKGEEDYFRIFFNKFNELLLEFNQNIQVVNSEVYDGFGSIAPMTHGSVRALHEKIFYHIFFGGKAIPDDCLATVEKTPRNIFHFDEILQVFPHAHFVCVYRDPVPVYRSLIRHLHDHRDVKFIDPEFSDRRSKIKSFCERWSRYITVVEKNRSNMHLVRYDTIAADVSGFLAYVQERIFKQTLELTAPIETLSKEYYLSQLPPEAREKSLVQTGQSKITLSNEEVAAMMECCRAPDVSYDY